MLRTKQKFNDRTTWGANVTIDTPVPLFEMIDALYTENPNKSPEGAAHNTLSRVTIRVKPTVIEVMANNVSHTIAAYTSIQVDGETNIDDELMFKLNIDETDLSELPPNGEITSEELVEATIEVSSTENADTLTITTYSNEDGDEEGELIETSISTTPEEATSKPYEPEMIDDVLDGKSGKVEIRTDDIHQVLPQGRLPDRSDISRLSTSDEKMLVEQFASQRNYRKGAWIQEPNPESEMCKRGGPVIVRTNYLSTVAGFLDNYRDDKNATFHVMSGDNPLVIEQSDVQIVIAAVEPQTGMDETPIQLNGFGAESETQDSTVQSTDTQNTV